MGAENCSFTIKGGTRGYVKKQVEAKAASDAYEYGHGGYTGTFAEWNGRIEFHDKVFKTYDKAYEYLFGSFSAKGKFTSGVLEKWENAVAVQYRNDAGQLVWLVGAVCSC